VRGTWKDLTDNREPIGGESHHSGARNIAEVTTAVARGDLSRQDHGDVKGEILELKNTINTMVDQLNGFAGEVTRVAREWAPKGGSAVRRKCRESREPGRSHGHRECHGGQPDEQCAAS